MARQKDKKKGRKGSNLFLGIVFLIGLLVMLYPSISDWYYKTKSNEIVEYFDAEKSKLSEEEIANRMELARAYNASLKNEVSHDPYSQEAKKEGRRAYARMLEIKEYLGHVEVPRIEQDLPLFAGTTEEVLQKGAGHLEGTSLPIGGTDTHAVITAHTGLPKMRLFTDLKKMKKGDRFYIHNLAEVLAYEVDQIKVIEPTDFRDLLIVKDEDYVTLLTCTPYMINTHRLLVRGHRIPYEKGMSKLDTKMFPMRKLIFLGIVLLCLLVLFFWMWKKRKKGVKGRHGGKKKK